MSATQTGRVLALLRSRGTKGIAATDFDPPIGGQVVDGRTRITRLAARIRDLRDAGHTIVKVGETREGFARYVLTAVAATDTPDTVLGWTREWQCYAETSPGRSCMAHLHGVIGETCPRGHASVLAHVLDTRRLTEQREEIAA